MPPLDVDPLSVEQVAGGLEEVNALVQ